MIIEIKDLAIFGQILLLLHVNKFPYFGEIQFKLIKCLDLPILGHFYIDSYCDKIGG